MGVARRFDGLLGGSRSWSALILRAACLTGMLALAGAMPACSKESRGDMAAKGGPPKAVLVTIAPVVSRSVPVRIDTFGGVEATATVAVRAQVNGTLVKVHFEKGQALHKGDVLFTIDQRPYQASLSGSQAALDQATASLDQAKAALDQAKANLERDHIQEANARREAERQSELLKKKVSSQTDYDNALAIADGLAAAIRAGEAAIRAGEATIRAGEATIRADQAAIDNAKLNLEFCTITCPIDGRAGNVLVHEGNLVKANDSMMVTINQVRPIDVFFSVREQDLGRIRQFMSLGKLTVRVGPTDQSWEQTGRLSFVDNAIDKEAGKIRLGAVFENAEERLWPGQYLKVSLLLTVQENAIVVPAKAVQTGRDDQTGGDIKFVYVAKDNKKVEFRPVTIGTSGPTETVVEKGLAVGETVVTDGQFRLTDGSEYTLKAGAPRGEDSPGPKGDKSPDRPKATTQPAKLVRGGTVQEAGK